MIKVKFWATINGEIVDEEAEKLWKAIERGKEINLMVFPSQSFVYGKTSLYVLVDIMHRCARLGHPIQLNIE